MKVNKITDAKHVRDDGKIIDCMLELDDGRVVPFSANADDVEAHGREIYKQLKLGYHGAVKKYEPKPEKEQTPKPGVVQPPPKSIG